MNLFVHKLLVSCSYDKVANSNLIFCCFALICPKVLNIMPINEYHANKLLHIMPINKFILSLAVKGSYQLSRVSFWLAKTIGSTRKTKSHVDECNEAKENLPLLSMPANLITKTKVVYLKNSTSASLWNGMTQCSMRMLQNQAYSDATLSNPS